ncbi:MAG: DUF2079 domain-containing protein [Clostridia bacterium]|nr:DUF2079 domain-containing protein [Clostridia bacterium]
MKPKSNDFLSRVRAVLTWERNICRAIAAWSLYALFILLTAEGDFFDLSFAQDASLGAMLLLTVALFCFLTVLAAVLQGYETDSWALLLGATGCVLRWVSTFVNDITYKVPVGGSTMQMNSDSTLFLLAVIFAYMLFVLYFLQKNDLLMDKLRIHSGVVLGAVTVLGLISATVIGVTTCMRYLTFTSPNFDFGLFVNMYHNMTETGLPLISSERDVLLSHFVVHISPIYYLLLPFYFIFPSAMTLQIGQAVLVASGIIPAILIARNYKLSNGTQILVALIYATYPAISMGCFYDFHENCFLLPLLLWVFYFFEKEKYLWMYVFAILTLGVKEDAAIYILFFALYVILSRKKFLHGTILALGAAAYFLVALAILEGSAAYWSEYYANDTPRPSIAGPMINRFDNLIYDKEKGLLGAILTALKNPGYLLTQFFSTQNAYLDSWFIERSPWAKVVYLIQMLLPVGMIPFCTKKQSRWLLLAPILLNVLTTYKYQYSINFQYHFAITAFIIYATILNLPDIQPIPRRRLLALGAVASCCMYIFLVIPKYNQYTDLWEKNKASYQYREEMLDTIPEGASLCVPSNYLAHCADRREVYDHSYHVMKGETSHLKEHDVDYAVLRNGTDDKYRKVFEAHGYTVWAEFEGHVILKSPHVE